MKILKILSGPVLGVVLGYLSYQYSAQEKIGWMVMVTVWMAAWWVLETVPLAITSLLPVFLFPFTGLMSTQQVASVYMNDVLFLFVGGFMMSFAMERWNLHRRIALNIILKVGTDGSKILLGLMLCSFIISMWISNTATTMMMIPTTLAIIYKIQELKISNHDNIAKALLLGIAHASTVGGVATVVGTPTNMIFFSYYQHEFPMNNDVTFFTWFVFGLPLAIMMFAATFFILKFFFLKKSTADTIHVDKSMFQRELHDMGKTGFEEKTVAVLFSVLVLLWFTRADLQLGIVTLKGWSNLFQQPKYIHDGAVAILVSLFLFIIPAKKENTTILTWEQVKKLPYSVILLFGGGFALSKGFDDSGLTSWLASLLEFLKNYHAVIIVFTVCIFITFISEFASNMATIQLSLPVLSAICISTGINPMLVMIPGTFAASYAFMMPVGTAPNTIIFGSEKLKTTDMMRPGLVLNLTAVMLITAMMFLWGKKVFGI
jgi:solute carrier family 13 (sodium-dependent dicarboxylate transporter), member 2/3/5